MKDWVLGDGSEINLKADNVTFGKDFLANSTVSINPDSVNWDLSAQDMFTDADFNWPEIDTGLDEERNTLLGSVWGGVTTAGNKIEAGFNWMGTQIGKALDKLPGGKAGAAAVGAGAAFGGYGAYKQGGDAGDILKGSAQGAANAGATVGLMALGVPPGVAAVAGAIAGDLTGFAIDTIAGLFTEDPGRARANLLKSLARDHLRGDKDYLI